MRISIPASLIATGARRAHAERIVDKLAAIPGVTAAAFASTMPDGRIRPPTGMPSASRANRLRDGEIPPMRIFKNVSPGFFHAAGTR